jgi:hypothetical protein
MFLKGFLVNIKGQIKKKDNMSWPHDSLKITLTKLYVSMCYSSNNLFTKTAIKPLVYKVERNYILGNLVARKALNLADLYSKKTFEKLIWISTFK